MPEIQAAAGPTVLFIGNYPPPYGGIPSHIGSLAPYLVSRGWHVSVLRPSHRPGPIEHVAGHTLQWRSQTNPVKLAASAVRHARLFRFDPAALLINPRMMASVLALFQSAMAIARQRPIDVIAAYHIFPAGLAGAWLSEVTGAALVTTVFGEVYSRPLHHERRIASVRLVADRSARLLSCSRHCANSLSALLGVETPVDVIYYGADVERIGQADGTQVRRDLGLDPNDRLVLFVGRMVLEMGLRTLIDATPAILEEPSAHVMIAGAAGVLTGEARALAARHPGRVTVRTDLTFDERDAAYAAADIHVAPSTNARACQGLALIEAMAAGTAVIGCNVGGTAEVVTDEVDGLLIPPHYPEGLARAVKRLIADRGLATRLAASGRERSRAFAFEGVNQQMESVLLDAIKTSRVRGPKGEVA